MAPSYFLGVSTPGHGAAVALLDKENILFAIEEAKLNRRQDSKEVPRLALERCLRENHIKLADCRGIGLGNRPIARSRKKGRKSPSSSEEQILQLLRGGPRVARLDHQLCHAASSYYTSGFDRALILSLDGGQASQTGLIALGNADEIMPLNALKFPDSFGWVYSRITELAGFRPNQDEHKLQWLSKDGQPQFLENFRQLFSWKSNGLPVLNRGFFIFGPDRLARFSRSFYRELGLSRATALSPEIRANLARSAQESLEESVLQLAANFHEHAKTDSLCLAGGLFLNVFLVRALEKRGRFKNVYVQPVSGNAGTALGAAFLSRKKITGRSGRAPLSTLALGVHSDPNETKVVLDNCKIVYRYLSGEEQILQESAQLLQRDKILAWCQGRSEFGHRALGQRSLLASPFAEYVVENINQFVKHREEFHPFALSVPAERAAEYFDASPTCRFMASIATLTKPVARLERFAFLGNSVRVHLVEREVNPLFWRLLHKFGEAAPAPILVNTSFNLFGEPLVTSPRGAVRSFYCAGVDALAIGTFLLVK